MPGNPHHIQSDCAEYSYKSIELLRKMNTDQQLRPDRVHQPFLIIYMTVVEGSLDVIKRRLGPIVVLPDQTS